jgi:hypothetical protein
MAQLKVPKGSEAKAKYHLRQLRKMFARANDHAFLQMIWAIDALQDDREDVAFHYLKTYPNEAAQSTQSVRDTPLGARNTPDPAFSHTQAGDRIWAQPHSRLH